MELQEEINLGSEIFFFYSEVNLNRFVVTVHVLALTIQLKFTACHTCHTTVSVRYVTPYSTTFILFFSFLFLTQKVKLQ